MPIDPANDDDFVDQWADADSERSAVEQPFGDSEQSVSIPEVASANDDIAEFDTDQLSSDLSAVDSDLLSLFTVSVLLIKVGVLLVSAGILLIVFRGHLEFGGGLVLVGAIALVRVVYKYYEYNRLQTPDDSNTTEHNQ